MKKMFSKAVTGGGMAIVMAAVLLFSHSALARRGAGQGKGKGHGPNPEHRAKKLGIVLDLTEAQERAVLALLKDEAKEIKAVREKCREEGRESRQQAHEEIIQIHERFSGLIQAKLSAVQAEKFRKLEELRKKQREKRREERKNPDK